MTARFQSGQGGETKHWPLWLQIALFLLLVTVGATGLGGHIIHKSVKEYLSATLEKQVNKSITIFIRGNYRCGDIRGYSASRNYRQ